MAAIERPQSGRERTRKPRPPLDAQALEELAVAYVARFATTAKKLESYCFRKIRERGWADDVGSEPPVARIVGTLVEKGYVDDAAYARARSDGLLRRGYGARRVHEALYAGGVAEADRPEIAEAAARHAALRMAKKRRFGPFGPPPDPARREKQVAAMLRAGHALDSARNLIDANSERGAEAWAREYDDEEP